MKKTRYSTLLVWTVVLSCALTWGCSEDERIQAKEQQAIKMVQAYKTSDDAFSVVSNIQKKTDEDNRGGNKWTEEKWESGLPSQKDLVLEKLNQYFTMFRPTGDYWVRFMYKDKDGAHEALWDVNIYSKKISPKNELAQQLSKAS
jgi:hypothetical protein